MSSVLNLKQKRVCKHSELFPSPLRMVMVGSSGTGKTKLLIHFLLAADLLDYTSLHICSPSLSQIDYKILIKCLEIGMTKEQIYNFYSVQNDVKDPDMALKTIEKRMKEQNIEHTAKIDLITYKSISDLPSPENIVKTSTKCLICIDDSILEKEMIKVSKLFTYLRPPNGNVIFLSQKYSKVLPFIRENTNMWILWRQSLKVVKDFIYPELASSDFDSADDFYQFCNKQWSTNKHNYISINVDTHKYTINMERTGSGIEKDNYLKSQAKAANAKRENIQAYLENKTMSNSFQQLMDKTFDPVIKQQEKTNKVLELLPQAEVKGAIEHSKTEQITSNHKWARDDHKAKNLVVKYLKDKENRDALFGLKVNPISPSGDILCYFGISDLQVLWGRNQEGEKSDFCLNKHFISFVFNADDTGDIYAKKEKSYEEEKAEISEELLAMLFKDTIAISDDIKKQYKKLLKFCIGEELDEIYQPSRNWKCSVKERQNIMKILEENSYKFREYIKPQILIKGKQWGMGLKSYRDRAKDPIVLPSNSNDKLRRLFVLIGSANAGNNSNEILKEASALLDELKKDGIITKEMYKTIYWKIKRSLMKHASSEARELPSVAGKA